MRHVQPLGGGKDCGADAFGGRPDWPRNFFRIRARRSSALARSGESKTEQFDKALGASRWPEGYFGLFGSIDDESFESPDELPANRDTHRERL